MKYEKGNLNKILERKDIDVTKLLQMRYDSNVQSIIYFSNY